MIPDVIRSTTLMMDGCTNFRRFLVGGSKPSLKQIRAYVDRSLMLVTVLSLVIGYDRAPRIACAMDNGFHTQGRGLEAGLCHLRAAGS